jgi:hypothetical protein
MTDLRLAFRFLVKNPGATALAAAPPAPAGATGKKKKRAKKAGGYHEPI